MCASTPRFCAQLQSTRASYREGTVNKTNQQANHRDAAQGRRWEQAAARAGSQISGRGRGAAAVPGPHSPGGGNLPCVDHRRSNLQEAQAHGQPFIGDAAAALQCCGSRACVAGTLCRRSALGEARSRSHPIVTSPSRAAGGPQGAPQLYSSLQGVPRGSRAASPLQVLLECLGLVLGVAHICGGRHGRQRRLGVVRQAVQPGHKLLQPRTRRQQGVGARTPDDSAAGGGRTPLHRRKARSLLQAALNPPPPPGN